MSGPARIALVQGGLRLGNQDRGRRSTNGRGGDQPPIMPAANIPIQAALLIAPAKSLKLDNNGGPMP